MNTGIYAIENTINGKMYVGSAVNLKVRKQQHLRDLRAGEHHSRKLQNSYNKHGKEAFVFKPLLVCRKEDLLFYEQLAIDKFNAAKGGYNIAPNAGSALGVKHSAEAKANYSAASKTKWADPEYKAKHAARMKIAMADPEYKARQSAALKTRWADPEFKAKHAATMADPECKAKQVAAQKANWADPEYKARVSAAIKASWAERKAA